LLREAQGTDGLLWFAASDGIAWVDPANISINPLPPPVVVRSVTANGKEFDSLADLVLRPRTTDLEISYTALSLSIPERVRFRYRLEGVDRNWEDVGTRREAFYTKLGPGKYQFRVIACNNDGIWNQQGASLVFQIAPAWYQTLWFRILCWFSLLALIWLVYGFRVRQIAMAINIRSNERLAERTRMARELHDTFLQTIQGSKMVVEDALNPGADEARMRQALQKLSIWLTQAVDEGRTALHALRVSTTERNHLSEALQRATEDPQIPSSMSVSFSVVGDARDLHPVVRDEVYRIAFEAIRNAALHSRASQLQVEIRYSNDLSVRVKDDGIGIDPSISDHGKVGHFGLQGMRERAARIHGKLSIRSSVNSGTDLILIVPGNIACRNNRPVLFARIKEQLARSIRPRNTDDQP
jgi:signal transduction histidine kinase